MIELAKEPVDETSVGMTARVIQDVDADVGITTKANFEIRSIPSNVDRVPVGEITTSGNLSEHEIPALNGTGELGTLRLEKN